MSYIQIGFIQNHYDSKGRTTHYRCTFPIPEGVARQIDINSVMTKGKRHWYVYASPNWEDVDYQVTSMQVVVNEYKVAMYKAKMEKALEKLSIINK